MTRKERILSAIAGKGSDVLPFVPRLDLWYKANKYNGTLPWKYRNASLMEITDDLDIPYHGVVPDFKDIDREEDEFDRALGIYRLRTMPYRVELGDVKRRVHLEGDITRVEYLTPVGNLQAKILYNEDMRKAGITISHILEPIIKDVEDYEAAAYVFQNLEVHPNYEGYEQFKDQVGQRGAAVAFVSLAASPMHLIQRELMDMNKFFLALYDHPDELGFLSDRIGDFYRRVFKTVSRSSAEIVFSGANYDSTITYPPYFAEHIAPSLAQQAEILHSRGSYLLTHTDGENRGLLDLYLKANIDVADSICPYPMTSLTLREVRDFFKGRITVWGGLPSVCVLEDSMDEGAFRSYIDNTLEQIGGGDRLILALADTTPPAAKFERIEHIISVCRDFGPAAASQQKNDDA